MASIKIEIFDGQIPLLDEISKAHYGLGLDALDHAGTVLRENTRKALLSSQRHSWSMTISKTGKRRIIFNPKEKQNPGIRRSHSTGKPFGGNGNMANFINSFLMEGKLTMVVAGKHPSFKPKRRRDGKVVGFERKVSGVTEQTYQILRKLDSGDADAEYRKHVNRPLDKEIFPNARYARRDFIAKGRSASMSRVSSIMTSTLEKAIGRQVNRANIKTRMVS